jgi:hypothetical protein
MKIKFIKIINYIKKYFKRFLKLEFVIICAFSIFLFPIIRPNIVWLWHIFFYKYIGEISGHKYIFFITVSLLCIILFGLITTIFSDTFKEYLKQRRVKSLKLKEIISSDLKFKKSEEVFSIYFLDIESWAKKNNLHDKIPDYIWEDLRLAKQNLNFRFLSYNRISFLYLLKRYNKINYYMKVNTKIFKLLRNNKSKTMIKKKIIYCNNARRKIRLKRHKYYF